MGKNCCEPTEGNGSWVAGMDYLTPWRRAKSAADGFNSAALAAGWDMSEMLAAPHVSIGGVPAVYLGVTTLERLTEFLQRGPGD